MHVKDAIGKAANELDRFDSLPVQMAGIEGEAEFFAAIECIENDFGGVDVEGDLAGVDFEGEADSAVASGIEYRMPLFGELFHGVGDEFGAWGRVACDVAPDGRAGESADDTGTEFFSQLERGDHFLRGPLVNSGLVAVAPNIVRRERLMAFIDRIGNTLADFVISDDGQLQVVPGEEFQLVRDGVFVAEGSLDLEMIAPAAEFHAVITPFVGLHGQCFEGQVGPGACKEQDLSWHRTASRRKKAWFLSSDSKCIMTSLETEDSSGTITELMDTTPAILGGPPAFPEGPPPWPVTTPEIRDALNRALDNGTWGAYHGPHLPEIEKQLAQQFQVATAVTVASGTLAVEIALRSVGVSAGDEVIMSAYDYESNFLTVHAMGAKPVLVDVSPENWNLSPEGLDLAISAKTKAMLVSHLHGGLVPMKRVREFASAHRLPIVEDAAQCPGASLDGKPIGGFGTVGVLSFGGSKLLSSGRGGALLFTDEAVAQRARLLLKRGQQHWATMSELQAIVLLPQLERLLESTLKRQRAVERLTKNPLPGLKLFANEGGSQAAYYKVGFQYDANAFGLSRELFVKALRAEGIAFDAGFKALHVGRSPSRYRSSGSLVEAERASEACVKLHHPVLLSGNEAVDLIARRIETIYGNANEILAAFPPS